MNSIFAAVVAGGIGCATFGLAVLLRRRAPPKARNVAAGAHGPVITEGLITADEMVTDYDTKLTELWGGPPPRHFREAFESWPARYPEVKGKVAVVTGGAAGIGFYISKMLAQLGAEVVLPWREGLRHEAESAVKAIMSASPGASVRISELPLDLGSFASVRAFATECRASLDHVDLLCLNAGRGGSKGDPRELTADGAEAIVQVNALSHSLLAAELMPLLLRSAAARIVSQSSGARKIWKPADVPHRMTSDISAALVSAGGYDAFSQYCLSKAANVFFTFGLNDALERAGVGKVIAVATDPGFASTGVNIQHNLGHSILGAPDGVVPTAFMHDVAGQHAADGALVQVLACVHPDACRNSFFSPDGGGLAGRPMLHTRETLMGAADSMKDPLLHDAAGSPWAEGTVGAFWCGSNAVTGAAWVFG